MRLSLLLSLFVLAGASPGAAQEPVAMDGGLKGVMYRPSGAGPFPAIVALHGCGGIGRNPEKPSRRHADWGERLAAAGFVVLFPDSFGSRGLGSQCNVRDRTVRPGRERVADAVVARRWLAGQPFVAGGDVNLLFGSHHQIGQGRHRLEAGANRVGFDIADFPHGLAGQAPKNRPVIDIKNDRHAMLAGVENGGAGNPT